MENINIWAAKNNAAICEQDGRNSKAWNVWVWALNTYETVFIWTISELSVCEEARGMFSNLKGDSVRVHNL